MCSLIGSIVSTFTEVYDIIVDTAYIVIKSINYNTIMYSVSRLNIAPSSNIYSRSERFTGPMSAPGLYTRNGDAIYVLYRLY
jgi:hypothetical protein